MFRCKLAVIVFAAVSQPLFGQGGQPTPSPFRAAPPPATLPPMPGMPPDFSPQAPGPNNIGGPAAQPVHGMPGAPAGAGAQAVGPPTNEPAIPVPPRSVPEPPARSSSATLIPFLDSTAPYVQAFDFVLMIIAGIFCLRARKAPGLTILAISCFVSAIILLGFFLFGIFHGHGMFPQMAYIVARALAPFELLLFVIGIIIVARRNASRTG